MNRATSSAFDLAPLDQAVSRIEKSVAALIDNGSIPNAMVLVNKGKERIVDYHRGRLDLSADAEIDPRAIFRFFSMSKPITSASVMTLVDRGAVALEHPVSNYIPAFADVRVRTGAGDVPVKRPVTLLDLMTHRSGLSYLPLPGPVTADYQAANVFPYLNREEETLAQHVERLAALPLAHQPGEAWTYGENMGVLGRIVEIVSGQSFGAYLKECLFDPLDMVDTGFHVPAEQADRLSALYQLSRDGVLEDVSNQAYYGGNVLRPAKLEYGGGGMVGTGSDIMNFALMLLGAGEFRGRRILRQESVRRMTTDQLGSTLGDTPLALLGRGRGTGFGLGGAVITATPEGAPPGAVGEYGWGGWAGLNFWIDPANDLAVVTMTQAIPPDLGPYPLGQAVRAALYKKRRD